MTLKERKLKERKERKEILRRFCANHCLIVKRHRKEDCYNYCLKAHSETYEANAMSHHHINMVI